MKLVWNEETIICPTFSSTDIFLERRLHPFLRVLVERPGALGARQ